MPKITGRPPKYDPIYCKQLTDSGLAGSSIMQMARDLKISRSTLYKWAEDHEEFKEALTKATEWGEAALEDTVALGMMGQIRGFNATAAAMLANRRYGKEWSNREGGGNTATNITINGNMAVLNSMPLKEIDGKIKAILGLPDNVDLDQISDKLLIEHEEIPQLPEKE